MMFKRNAVFHATCNAKRGGGFSAERQYAFRCVNLGLSMILIDKLVEAAGVEPASEKVNREKTTCVSDSVILVRLMRNRQERGGLA